MRELSLFTGAGGGLLGSKLLGWKTIGYVEINDYCQRVIAQRIKDGILDDAPIFGDIRTFISEGYAASYKGMVDVITGGFPCQPHSLAGKKLGADDPRDLWPETCKVIETVRPRFAFLENVQGIVSSGYIIRVIRDFRGIGYGIKPPLLLGSSDCGADHVRKRCWIFAYAEEQQIFQLPKTSLGADASGLRHEGSGERKSSISYEKDKNREASGFINAFRKGALPYLCRDHNELANGMDRIAAIGNGQDPIVVRAAWNILNA